MPVCRDIKHDVPLSHQHKIEIPEDIADHLLQVCAQALQQRGKRDDFVFLIVISQWKECLEVALEANMGHGKTHTIRPVLACSTTDTFYPTVICTHRPAKEQQTIFLVIVFILFDIVHTFQSIQVPVYSYNHFIPQSHLSGSEFTQ